ncbi:MAG: OsmC family protein [Acidobacteria bacterium]|nr:OsmC family protein [Acidobacteriota bacterium]
MDREMKITFPGNKRIDAEYKGFTIQTDQPVHQGGDGSAPAPFDLFLVSLGTCAGFYLMSFCQSRGIPGDGISVTLATEIDTKIKRITKVIIEAHLPSDFPEKYTKAAIRAMEMCAVKKYLDSPFEMETLATIKN